MKNRVLAKSAAVLCALFLAIGVMSGAVFARDEEPTEEMITPPEATFVVIDASEETEISSVEIIDNRTSVPLFVNESECGVCPIVNGEPYANVKAFCAALGLNAQVSETDGGLALEAEDISLTANGDVPYFVCNGRYMYLWNGICTDENGTCLPVEALAKCFGVSAEWDRTEWRITISAEGYSPLESGDTYYDETDVYWLSRVIYAEAGNQSLEGRIAVGNVVMNRIQDEQFVDQNSVYDVVFAKNQFEVVINGMIYMTPDEDAEIAAKIALEGEDLVSGATYFATFDFGEGYECVTWIEDHCFMTAA